VKENNNKLTAIPLYFLKSILPQRRKDFTQSAQRVADIKYNYYDRE
jgi:hypothetical protein